MRDELLRQATRIVIKIGSSLVASRDTGLRPEQIDRLADEIAALRSSGREVLIVSSGAIVSGIKRTARGTSIRPRRRTRPPDVPRSNSTSAFFSEGRAPIS